MKLSIVVPSYNETIKVKKEAVDAIKDYLKEKDFGFDVLIIDDKSTNNTLDDLKKYIKDKSGFEILENSHGGKAITVMSGMLKAKGEVALFTDMDQATPIDELDKLLPKFKEGFDIVIGSRKGRKGAPPLRKLTAWGFAFLRNIFLGLPYHDTQCGFKAFTNEAINSVFPDLLKEWQKREESGAAVNAGFDIETLYLSKKKGLKIAEVEVNWHHVENVKQIRPLKEAIDAIKDMIRIRLNHWQGKYK